MRSFRAIRIATAVPPDESVHGIACGSRLLVHDGPFLPYQAIEQGRLADVRTADERETGLRPLVGAGGRTRFVDGDLIVDQLAHRIDPARLGVPDEIGAVGEPLGVQVEQPFRFDAAGPSLKLYLNGNLIASATDGALTTGAAGMLSIGGGSFDNFQEIPQS